MHFNTPKSKRRISIKKKRYTVNLSINLKGNVGNISMFVEILLWFNVISNRFVLLKRQVFFLSIHIQNTIVLSSHSKQTRKTNEYIYLNQLEVNFQPGSRVHQSLFSAAEQKMFLLLLKIFPSLRLSSSQKISIDSLPSKRIFPQTYIYIVI